MYLHVEFVILTFETPFLEFEFVLVDSWTPFHLRGKHVESMIFFPEGFGNLCMVTKLDMKGYSILRRENKLEYQHSERFGGSMLFFFFFLSSRFQW